MVGLEKAERSRIGILTGRSNGRQQGLEMRILRGGGKNDSLTKDQGESGRELIIKIERFRDFEFYVKLKNSA